MCRLPSLPVCNCLEKLFFSIDDGECGDEPQLGSGYRQLATLAQRRPMKSPDLTGALLDTSVAVMQPLWRRLVVLLVTLALISGGAIGIAVPNAGAAERCTQEYGHADHHPAGHQHGKKSDHQNSGTRALLQCCCVGICGSLPDLPMSLSSEPVIVTLVAYWDTARFGIGRTIKPEHGPPRPLA